MNICCKILGWKDTDVEFLENLIDNLDKNTKFTINDVIEEVKSINLDLSDINYLIYATLYLNEQAIRDKCIEYFPNLKDEIQNLESNIFCNYIDSGYDSEFSEWNWDDYYFSNRQDYKEQYVKDFLDKFNLEV